jgi:hypothetical protein
MQPYSRLSKPIDPKDISSQETLNHSISKQTPSSNQKIPPSNSKK